MTLKAEEKTIDGHKVTVTQFPAWTAFNLQIKVIGLLGPSLITGLSGLKTLDFDLGNLNDEDFNFEKIGKAFTELFTKLTPEVSESIVRELIVSTRVDGQEIANDDIFDDIFSGKLDLMFKVVGYAVQVNYKSFLGLLNTGKGKSRSKRGTKLVSSKT